MISLSINKQNSTHGIIKQNGKFAVSVLSEETPLSFIDNFGFECGRDLDKLKDLNYAVGTIGSKIALTIYHKTITL